jgi:hypothetical protein
MCKSFQMRKFFGDKIGNAQWSLVGLQKDQISVNFEF